MCAEGRRRWVLMYPDVAIAVDRCLEMGGLAEESWADLKERYPDAIRGYTALKLCSPETVRRMRQRDPGWEPPPLDVLLQPRAAQPAGS
jgi:hypothetical protein